MLKICTKCKLEKSTTSFNRNKNTLDSLRYECKDCQGIDYSKYRKTNQSKIQSRQREWNKSKPGYMTAKSALYYIKRSKRSGAIPKWLTEKDWALILDWYTLREELQWLSQEELHVDHIIPIHGEIICGLHVPDNLQILPASLNVKKGNKFP